MKKVTIPTCANPFVVIVNGMKYTYPAGETVEVPDDVAEVIEQHEETHNNPKPAPVVPPFAPAPSEEPSEGESGGGMPTLEFTTVATAEGNAITADEIASMDAIDYAPCIMKCSIDLGGMVFNVAGVALSIDMMGTKAYYLDCALLGTVVTFDDNGTLKLQYQSAMG